MMNLIALMSFIALQILFLPLAILGIVVVTVKQLFASQRLGVSSTAVSAIGGRWLMHVFGIRKDPATALLYGALPNGSVTGLWLLFFPSYIRYKISGRNSGYTSLDETGKERLHKVVFARTIRFDQLLNKSKDTAAQFVVLGAGFDARCYGELKTRALKFFELDQERTQELKINCLSQAGIDSSHVRFVAVDFSSDDWQDKLVETGYDSSKKTIFLWEGVTIYLPEAAVRKTLKKIKNLAAPGSVILVDFYARRLTSRKGISATKEEFHFGLAFAAAGDNQQVVHDFVQSAGLQLGDVDLMGYKNEKGPFGAVAELIV